MNEINWIPRNIEPTIAKWMITPCSIVLIRGHRRMGKSSTVQRVANELDIKPLTIIIDSNEDKMLSYFTTVLKQYYKISSVYDIGKAIVETVRNGVVVILKEIQNASTSLQVSLQFGFDYMAQQSMWDAHHWRESGMVFLMGSVQGEIDDMIENRKSPLYQRITAKITLLGCNTSEMVYFFKQHNLFGDPMLMLFLQTIFRGRLHSYSIIHKAGLLKSTDRPYDQRAKIIKEVFASELQSEYFDGHKFFVARYGKKIALALKAICQSETKLEQIEAVSRELSITFDEAFTMVDWVLFKRYILIAPVYAINNLKSVKKYVLLDPMLAIANDNMNSDYMREDINRCADLSFHNYIEQFEGFHFESWVETIIEDRYLLANSIPIPRVFDAPELCKRLPKVSFDIAGKSIEIDVILGFPHSNTIVLGSCKRSSKATDVCGLRRHWSELKNSECITGILKCLSLKADKLRECLVHFNTDTADERFHQQLRDNEFIVTLTELLDIFPIKMSNYSETYTKPVSTRLISNTTLKKPSSWQKLMCNVLVFSVSVFYLTSVIIK